MFSHPASSARLHSAGCAQRRPGRAIVPQAVAQPTAAAWDTAATSSRAKLLLYPQEVATRTTLPLPADVAERRSAPSKLPPAPPSDSRRLLPRPPAPEPPKQPVPEPPHQPWLGWYTRPHHLKEHQVWARLCEEAVVDVAAEPSLATFLHTSILSHSSLAGCLAFLLANKLGDGLVLGPVQLMTLIREAYTQDPSLLAAAVADINAVLDRDPACAKYSQCLLNFKGYQAVQTYRITHHLWVRGRKTLALALQARASELWAVDIHPAARLGKGVMLDHATGITIGETSVVGDNVSMLHHVTLGGSGAHSLPGGVRHPNIGHGVLLGAGVAVLGPVVVGAGSKVGAGSLVVADLPAHCVAVGVPARIVKRNLRQEQADVKEMDQCLEYVLDYVI